MKHLKQVRTVDSMYHHPIARSFGQLMQPFEASFHTVRKVIARCIRWLHENTFIPLWMPRRWRPPLVGYGAAVLCQITLGLISLMILNALLEYNFSGIIQLFGVLIIALVWGVGPSFLATFTGTTIVLLFHIEQLSSGVNGVAAHLIGVGIFLIVGCAISSLVSQAVHAQQAAETARKDVEAAKKAEAQRANEFAVLFDSLVDGVMVMDPDGRIVRANTAYKQLCTDLSVLKLTLRERMAYFDIHTDQGTAISLEEMPNMRILRGEVLQGPTAVDLQIHSPTQGIRYHDTNGAPLRNEAGEITGGVMVLRDYTERRQWERHIQNALDAMVAIATEVVRMPIKQEVGAENAAQRIAELICQILHCYRVGITTVNPANEEVHFLAMTGLSPDQAVQLLTQTESRTLGEFLSEEQIARLRRGEVFSIAMPTSPVLAGLDFLGSKVLLAPQLVEGHLIGMIYVVFARQDDPIPAEDMLVASTIAKLLAIVMERKRLLEEQTTAQARILALQQAKEQMDVFMNMASHELRTPLTSIIGYTQLARRRLSYLSEVPESEQEGKIAQVAALLDDADTQAVYLNRLVGDLLEVSRAAGKKLSLQLVVCDITDIVREAIQGQQVVWLHRQIMLQQAEPTPLLVQVDRGRILQVVTNYLTNALKYAPADYPVIVGMHQDAERVRVFVADQGPGIPAEEQERIWERFYRTEGRTPQNNVIPGLGMGLYLSRAIVEQHGGQVGVDSQVGKGSTFWFTLARYHDENHLR